MHIDKVLEVLLLHIFQGNALFSIFWGEFAFIVAPHFPKLRHSLPGFGNLSPRLSTDPWCRKPKLHQGLLWCQWQRAGGRRHCFGWSLRPHPSGQTKWSEALVSQGWKNYGKKEFKILCSPSMPLLSQVCKWDFQVSCLFSLPHTHSSQGG